MNILYRRLTAIFVLSVALFLSSFHLAQAQSVISVDYQKQVSTGSPLIFGGTSTPNWQAYHQIGWNMMQDVGVKFIRQDLNFESFIVGPNMSVANWKSNPSYYRNPANWHQGGMDYIANKFLDARKRGMKTMAITSYAPSWLTYGSTYNGIPSDWQVWQEMVQTTITYFKQHYGITFDYYEVWNEPGDEWFSDYMNLRNSPYMNYPTTTRQQIAYADMYYYTQSAIKAVDPAAKIGGPADYQPLSTVKHLNYDLQDARIKDKFDFISFHFYDRAARRQIPAGQDIIQPIVDTLKKYGKGSLPIMISEGNYTCCGYGDTNGTAQSVSYWGDQFAEFLRTGLLAYGYFAMSNDLCKSVNLCFFTYNGTFTQAQPQPEALTWRLLSKQLKFGDGPSRIMTTTYSPGITGVGALNVNNEPVAFVSNNSATAKTVTLNLNNLTINGNVPVKVYQATAGNDPIAPSQNLTATLNQGDTSMNLSLPAWSVTGVILAQGSSPPPSVPPSPTIAPNPTPTPSSRACQADINRDGTVNVADYSIFVANFLKNPVSNNLADINADGTVNLVDYSLFVPVFFQTCS